MKTWVWKLLFSHLLLALVLSSGKWEQKSLLPGVVMRTTWDNLCYGTTWHWAVCGVCVCMCVLAHVHETRSVVHSQRSVHSEYVCASLLPFPGPGGIVPRWSSPRGNTRLHTTLPLLPAQGGPCVLGTHAGANRQVQDLWVSRGSLKT